MTDERSIVRRIAWHEVCPWLMIFRAFRLSISLPVLCLATIGTALTWDERPLGWLWSHEVTVDASLGEIPLSTEVELPAPLAESIWLGRHGVSGVYWFFAEPVWRLFDRTASFSNLLGQLLRTAWNVGVWSLLAGAITRIAVVKFGRDERTSTLDALRHARKNWGWYASAPLFPLLGVALITLPVALLGILLRADLFAFLGGLLWPLVLVGGLMMTLLMLGLLAGWPLMWPTISAEDDSDAFEAFNRSYSYSFQRPLQYLFYATITVAFGQLCWFLVDHFADAVVGLSQWSLSFGAGNERVSALAGAVVDPLVPPSGGVRFIAWWNGAVRLIAQSFNFSFFFCASSAIYLLLRREVDQTDFDEVYVPDEATRYGLPQLRTSSSGVPEAVDAVDSEKSSEAPV